MCGIFGCILRTGDAATEIHKGLKKLEYRGYDSVGIATLQGNRLFIKKDMGKIDSVHAIHNLDALPGRLGIGHTRWATHGAPYQVNAHPHTDCNNQIAVVHNGIIENFAELKAELEESGHTFRSKTDTEVIPHLVEKKMKDGLSLVEAVRATVKRLEGSYALAVISVNEPNKIVCARKESPLVFGVNEDSIYVASDIPAFLSETNKSVVINDGELVVLSYSGYEIRNIADWKLVTREPEIIDWAPEMAEKQGYPHFMLKEIHEQPLRLRNFDYRTNTWS
jgi:glucosamine--fructose-6-phosphate aminotransferase (isomerizing)